MLPMADGDQLWIDGELIPDARNLAFHPDAIAASNEHEGFRACAASVVGEELRESVDPEPRDGGATEGPYYRAQVRFAEGPRTLLGLHCTCLKRQGLAHCGMFFELQEQPSPQLGPARRGTSEVVLAIDGLVVLDPILAGSLEPLPGSSRGPWVSSLLRLWLAPGRSPSRFLASLCQRRAARWLTLRLDGVCFSLEELGTLRASLIAPTDVAWKGPAPEGVALEFVLESRPPTVLARAPELEQLPDKLAAIHDPNLDSRRREQLLADLRWLLRCSPPNTRWLLAEPLPNSANDWASQIEWFPAAHSKLELVALTPDAKLDLASATKTLQLGAELWQSRWRHRYGGCELGVRVAPIDEVLPVIEAVDAARGVRWPGHSRVSAALARAHGDGLRRAVANLLDREGCNHRDAWTVFADHLQQRGDARGELLAKLVFGEDSSALESAIMATLDERERQLRATPPGGRLRFGDREWSPRVWATWVGPMIVQLAVEPEWTRVVEDDGLFTRDRMPYGGNGYFDELMIRQPQSIGQLVGVQAWDSVPGYHANAELKRLLELPCCALLSPRRILRAGLQSADASELDMSGADLRELNLGRGIMRKCNFRGANLSGARFDRTKFVACDLRDVELRGAEIDAWGIHLLSCDLRGAKWQEVKGLHHVSSEQIVADPELAAQLEKYQRARGQRYR
jgi:hypothetical protein